MQGKMHGTAKPAEAEELTDIAWRSKGYWDYPSEVMSRFRGLLTIKQDFVEANPTYLIEHDDTGEKLGCAICGCCRRR